MPSIRSGTNWPRGCGRSWISWRCRSVNRRLPPSHSCVGADRGQVEELSIAGSSAASKGLAIGSLAESELTVLRLSVESLDRLTREHPALAAKLLNNIALHLAQRVRLLTVDLAGWMARSRALRPAGGETKAPQASA